MGLNAQQSCGIAQRTRVRWTGLLGLGAALWCAAAPTGSAVPAQDLEAALPLPHEAQLARLIHSPDPVLRGEAALGLSLTGRPAYYSDIRAVARDDHPEASVRGTIALGYLGVAGAEVELGQYLVGGRRDDATRDAAAFALGVMPDEHPTPAIDQYLTRFVGGSYKRHRDTLACLFLGLAQQGHPSRLRSVLGLLTDEANKDLGLHLLALRMLARIEGALTETELIQLLDSDSPAVRAAVLEEIVHGRLGSSPDLVGRIEQMASKDASGAVRAAALSVLCRERRPAALDLAPRAIGSRTPAEAAAAVHAVLSLGGGLLRAALERRVLAEENPATKTAMLAAWQGRASPGFVDGCFGVSADPRIEPELRAAAARIVADAHETRIVPVLRRLLLRVESPDTLAMVVARLMDLGAGDELGTSIYPDSGDGFQWFAARLQALFQNGHPSATELLRRALEDDRFTPPLQAGLLRSWRVSKIPPPSADELAELPEPVARALR